MKAKRHFTCPYCNREVVSHVIRREHLYKACPICGEDKKDPKHNAIQGLDMEITESELFFIFSGRSG